MRLALRSGPTRVAARRTRLPAGPWLLALLLALVAGAASRTACADAKVAFEVNPRSTFVGQPVTVRITVSGAAAHDQPVLPQIPGAEVSLGGTERTQSAQLLNGRMVQTSTVTYRFLVSPSSPGVMTIPSIAVRADGRDFTSDAWNVEVKPLASDDRFTLEVAADPAEAWVGQAVDLTLRVWVRPYIDRRWSIQIPAESMWSAVEESSQWGIFEPAMRALAQRQQRPPSRVLERVDANGVSSEYYVYEIRRRVYPGRPGPLDLGDLALRMRYPTKLSRSDDFFDRGQLRMTESVPLVATARPPALVVKPLPEAGRPASFGGAVGRFELETSAEPTDVAVGEPISLKMIVKDRTIGGAELTTLSPPNLAEQPALVSEFRVASDPIAGEVQGWMKSFTQSIRPLRDAISAIPPIEFSYFDPSDAAYHEIRSSAIPIKVRPGLSLDAARIVDARGDLAGGAATTLSDTAGGVLANETDLRRLLGSQPLGLTPIATALGVAPPLLLLAVASIALARRVRDHDPAGRRRRSALRRARQRLATAGSASELRAALVDAVCDLAGVPAGALTAREATGKLASLGASSDCVDTYRASLEACEQVAYAPSGSVDLNALRVAAQRALSSVPMKSLEPLPALERGERLQSGAPR